MKAKLLSILMIVTLAISCKTRQDEPVYTKHFVMVYDNTIGIKLSNFLWKGDGDIYEHKIISISTTSDLDNPHIGKKEYEVLCTKHGDWGYNRYVLTPPCNGYSNADFISVSITSDADFDETHFNGAELGDLIIFESHTPVRYIRSGYVGDNIFDYIYKLASELSPDDLILLGLGSSYTIANLYFGTPPTISKTHNITVTLTADDGRVFSDTVQVSWE